MMYQLRDNISKSTITESIKHHLGYDIKIAEQISNYFLPYAENNCTDILAHRRPYREKKYSEADITAILTKYIPFSGDSYRNEIVGKFINSVMQPAVEEVVQSNDAILETIKDNLKEMINNEEWDNIADLVSNLSTARSTMPSLYKLIQKADGHQ